MFLAFFAGVLVTLYVLIPGKHGPTILVNGDEGGQFKELGRAGDRVERFGDTALVYAYKAKDMLGKIRVNRAEEDP